MTKPLPKDKRTKGSIDSINGYVFVEERDGKRFYVDTVRRMYVGVPFNPGENAPVRAFYCSICEKEIPDTEIQSRNFYRDINGVKRMYINSFHMFEKRKHWVRLVYGAASCEAQACPMCGASSSGEFGDYCSQQHKSAMLKRLANAMGIERTDYFCSECNYSLKNERGYKIHLAWHKRWEKMGIEAKDRYRPRSRAKS